MRTPADAVAGAVSVRFDAIGTDKRLADSAFARFSLCPAASIELWPPRSEQGKIYMRVKVYPKVQEDLTGVLKMKIAIDDRIIEQEQPIDLSGGKTENEYAFTAECPETEGHTIVATYTTRCENRFDVSLTRTLSRLPVRYVGPFPRSFDEAYPPEKQVDLTKTYATVDGEAGWKPGLSRDDGLVELGEKFKTRDNVCAYAVTYVNSAADQEAILSCGSDDGIKAWVNGKLAISDDASRGAEPGQDKARIALKKGWNTLLIKITQGGGGWGFFLELTSMDGQA